MHPLFAKLFPETDTDDLLDSEEDERHTEIGPNPVQRVRP